MAAKALLMYDDLDLKVDGETSFITDDAPIPFWDFQCKTWAAVGNKTPLANVHVIPAWVGYGNAYHGRIFVLDLYS